MFRDVRNLRDELVQAFYFIDEEPLTQSGNDAAALDDRLPLKRQRNSNL